MSDGYVHNSSYGNGLQGGRVPLGSPVKPFIGTLAKFNDVRNGSKKNRLNLPKVGKMIKEF